PERRGRRLPALAHALSPPAPGPWRPDRGGRLLAPAVARQGALPPRLLRRRRPALRAPAGDGRRHQLVETENAMKRIWLTGASSGIGAALAEELLRAGHQLALSARTLAPLEDFAERYGDQVLVVPGDLGDPLQVHQIGNRIDRTWGA